jgi:2'-5' RNA ligase
MPIASDGSPQDPAPEARVLLADLRVPSERINVSPPALRLFVAIAPPISVREALLPALEQTRAIAQGAKITHPDDLHLTLLFLGATPKAEQPRIEAALHALAAKLRPLPIALSGTGSFGPHGQPRVLYAAARTAGAPAEEEPLADLARRVRQALGAPDEGRFVPHVTLARARGRKGDPALAAARKALTGLSCPPFAARFLALYESLPPQAVPDGGARYRILAEAPLPP